MLAAAQVAFFLLSTTSSNGPPPQKMPTYFQSRTIPIHETYGSFFPHFYFVFGHHPGDFKFLQNRCDRQETWGEAWNSANSEANMIRNSTDVYSCPLRAEELKWNVTNTFSPRVQSPITQMYQDFQHRRSEPIKALYHANCTGKYFGIGPTCRCQESMRYFLTHPRFLEVKWFIFMDDDLHYRPYSLLTFLHQLQHQTNDSAVALVAGMGLQGFRQFKSKLSSSGQHQCNDRTVHRFAYAQPAILNR